MDGESAGGGWSRPARGVRQRLVVEGTVTLVTPAHLGNGDGDALVDLPLLRDAVTGAPLLQGTSLAGAMRAYLLRREFGERPDPTLAQHRQSAATSLFGGSRADVDGAQSPLVVEDSRGTTAVVEVRDGVRLSGATRTAAHGAKFDLETWPAGTTFPVRLELALTGRDDDRLRAALATALAGFADGGIRIGARTQRGYGRLAAGGWTLKTYDLHTPGGIAAWLRAGHADLEGAAGVAQTTGTDSFALLAAAPLPDTRRAFALEAEFALRDSLIIRASPGTVTSVDAVHLASPHGADGSKRPIVPGTSLAGALRARAGKIVRTTTSDPAQADLLVDEIFGGLGDDPHASRITVEELPVDSPGQDQLSQTRIAIDPFTGGVVDGALFTEAPLFAGDATRVRLSLRLVNPREHEVGLLLLLLKDLWTEDLPLGGESAAGRGRLRGLCAELRWTGEAADSPGWSRIEVRNGTLAITGERTAADLERMVQAFNADGAARSMP